MIGVITLAGHLQQWTGNEHTDRALLKLRLAEENLVQFCLTQT